jgi:hypothetical protein
MTSRWSRTGEGPAFTNPPAAGAELWLQEARSATWLSCEPVTDPKDRPIDPVTREMKAQARDVLRLFAQHTQTSGNELGDVLRALVATQDFSIGCGSSPLARMLLCDSDIAPGSVPLLPSVPRFDRADLDHSIEPLDRLRTIAHALVTVEMKRTEVSAWLTPLQVSSTTPRAVTGEEVLSQYGLPPIIAALESETLDWEAAKAKLVAPEQDVLVRFLLARRVDELRTAIEAARRNIPADRLTRAKSAWKDWDQRVQGSERQTLARVYAAAPDNDSGCAELKQIFAQRIKEKSPASLDQALKLLPDLMLEATLPGLSACYRTHRADGAAAFVSRWLHWRGHTPLGPRAAAMMEVARPAAGGDAGQDKAPSNLLPESRALSKVIQDRSGSVLELKPDVWNEDVFNCYPTRRIERITHSGEVIYEEVCNKVGTKRVTGETQRIYVSVPHLAAKRANVALLLGHVSAVALALYPDDASAGADRNLLVFLNVPL